MRGKDNNADQKSFWLGYCFAKQCAQNANSVVAELARRDGAVVRQLPDGKLALGPAGQIAVQPSSVSKGDEPDASIAPGAANLVSELPRIANLYALKEDLEKSEGGR